MDTDYTYDIPLEDLKRYRRLPPREILRWLQDINEFNHKTRTLTSPEPSKKS